MVVKNCRFWDDIVYVRSPICNKISLPICQDPNPNCEPETMFPHLIGYLALVGCPILIEHSRLKIRGSTWDISVVSVGKSSVNLEFQNWYVDDREALVYAEKKHSVWLTSHFSESVVDWEQLTQSTWNLHCINICTYLLKKDKTQKNTKNRKIRKQKKR